MVLWNTQDIYVWPKMFYHVYFNKYRINYLQLQIWRVTFLLIFMQSDVTYYDLLGAHLNKRDIKNSIFMLFEFFYVGSPSFVGVWGPYCLFTFWYKIVDCFICMAKLISFENFDNILSLLEQEWGVIYTWWLSYCRILAALEIIHFNRHVLGKGFLKAYHVFVCIKVGRYACNRDELYLTTNLKECLSPLLYLNVNIYINKIFSSYVGYRIHNSIYFFLHFYSCWRKLLKFFFLFTQRTRTMLYHIPTVFKYNYFEAGWGDGK